MEEINVNVFGNGIIKSLKKGKPRDDFYYGKGLVIIEFEDGTSVKFPTHTVKIAKQYLGMALDCRNPVGKRLFYCEDIHGEILLFGGSETVADYDDVREMREEILRDFVGD